MLDRGKQHFQVAADSAMTESSMWFSFYKHEKYKRFETKEVCIKVLENWNYTAGSSLLQGGPERLLHHFMIEKCQVAVGTDLSMSKIPGS